MVWFLLIFFILVIGVLGYLYYQTCQKYEQKIRELQKSLEPISAVIDSLKGTLDRIREKPQWLDQLVTLLTHNFGADGACVYYLVPTENKKELAKILCTTGICRQWNLVIGDDTQVISPANASDTQATRAVYQFEPQIPADFFWSRQPHLYEGDGLVPWLPPGHQEEVRYGLVAPLRTDRYEAYLLLLRGPEKDHFSREDQKKLEYCLAIAEAGFAALRAEQERSKAEEELHFAHEEGMLQISTGIIHNIGNGITVIQIALERLKTGELQNIRELAELIDREIIPGIMENLEAGRLQYFLTEDPQGQEYLGALKTLIQEVPRIISETYKELDFIIEKFRNVTEIISLQQQFIGELGTENICSINTIVTEALKICQQPIEENHIELRQHLSEVDRILVDTAMFRHIILILMKMAIEAAATSRRAKAMIRVETFQEKREDYGNILFVAVRITDNGAGRDIVLDEKLAIAERSAMDEDVRNLLFIKNRIQKYGGFLEIKSEFGIGTRVTIFVPSYDANPRVREHGSGRRSIASQTQQIKIARKDLLANLSKTDDKQLGSDLLDQINSP